MVTLFNESRHTFFVSGLNTNFGPVNTNGSEKSAVVLE